MEIEPRLLETQDALDHALRVVDTKASERKQILTSNVEPEAAILYADARAFTQIAINLLSNAVKFAPDGGHIVVNARRDGNGCLLYTSPSPRDRQKSRMPSSA